MRQIPNILTLMNLIVGVLGIINLFQGDYTNTIFFIFLSAFFDFLDGFAARALNVSGPMGKELDSLADVVSFGVLPSLYLFQLSRGLGNPDWANYSTLIVAALSAYRLAKFNVDTRQTDKFIGLPTPANAILLTTFAQLPIHLVPSEPLIVSLSIVSAVLLIAPFELIAFKFKSFSFGPNAFRYLLLLVYVVLIAFLGWGALPFLVPVYLFMSVVAFFAAKNDGDES
jgi:CDP-diacylglycerol--serine O-phosphatidyltransferase